MSPSLSDNQQFRLNRINEIRGYFVAEIKEKEFMSKRLSKYIASFDYFDKSLIVLSVTTGSTSIASFATVIGATVGFVSAGCTLTFLISTGKKQLKTTRNKKKKHNKSVMLVKSKLNSIESKIFKALTNNEIEYEDFVTIIDEEKKYRELKESVRIMESHRSDAKKIKEVLNRNKVIDNSLKP